MLVVVAFLMLAFARLGAFDRSGVDRRGDGAFLWWDSGRAGGVVRTRKIAGMWMLETLASWIS
jgi:hypothetical protein